MQGIPKPIKNCHFVQQKDDSNRKTKNEILEESKKSKIANHKDDKCAAVLEPPSAKPLVSCDVCGYKTKTKKGMKLRKKNKQGVKPEILCHSSELGNISLSLDTELETRKEELQNIRTDMQISFIESINKHNNIKHVGQKVKCEQYGEKNSAVILN